MTHCCHGSQSAARRAATAFRHVVAEAWERRIPRNLVAVGLALTVGMPTAVDARPGQQEPPATGGGNGASGDATLAIDVDVSVDEVDDVTEALGEIFDNVIDQYDELIEARTSLDDATTDWEDAQTAVEDTEELIDDLVALSDGVVIGTYVSPPNMADTDALSSRDVGELAVKQSLLDVRAEDDADVLSELADARDELEDQQEDEEDAESDAHDAMLDAEAELGDLEAAAGQQGLFFTAVEDRLEHGAGELESLAEVDPEAAAALQDEQDDLLDALQDILDEQELAEALATLAAAEEEREAREEAEAAWYEGVAAAEAEEAAEPPEPEPSSPAPAPEDLGAATGSLSDVSCPSGGSITVDSSLASNLRSMLQAANSAGVSLCGGGYRDPSSQIALRQQNCGTSQYAIYEMPSSQCSPPTARPGTSMHEQGLAVDFENCSTRSTACYQWLASNASSYGLYNLPSEPWHWSTDGT